MKFMLLQVLDVDYILNTNKPIIRVFGKTDNGNTVCVFYDRFEPYFYVKAKQNALEALNKAREVTAIEEVEKFLPTGYSEKPAKLLKLTVRNPQDVPVLRETLLKDGLIEASFDSDILFRYRFMVDHEIRGMSWISCDVEKTFTKTVKTPAYHATKIIPVNKGENTQMKYMAFDIECLQADTRRPIDSKKDMIIMISVCFEPAHRGNRSVVLVAKPYHADDVMGFKDEKEMLEEFLKLIEAYDPDIVTGYNINTFDMPYLLNRLKNHNIAPLFGRCNDKTVYTKEMAATTECHVPGRIVADPYQILRRDPWIRFHRYDLNTIATALLNEKKMDVAYRDIQKLWEGDRMQTNRLIEYARKDAELSLRLLVEKGMLDKFFELSKISGLLVQDCFGGQSTRIENLLMHEFRKRGFVMPSKPSGHESNKRKKEREDKGLKGATVLEPDKGLHAEGCTLVLDFRSLYPNIMRAFNISPDTLLQEGAAVQSHKTPSGSYFVDREVREGIFPIVLTELLDARAHTKKQMKTATGEMKKILNAKQLAFKDMANSIYGYTGYIRARLYMIDLANSVTAYGRENILKTKKIVEDNFTAKVVYGDTDSIFLKTKTTNLDDAKRMGEEISKFVSEKLPNNLELEFEKIYRTFLILTKKRYAGWKFTYDGNEWKNDIEMKGIETIRRDWCGLVTETMRGVLDIVMKEGDIQKAIAEVKVVIDKLKNGQIPLEKLAVVKGVTKSIDSYDGIQPHIELAKKLNERNPHDPVKVGDRLRYVIIKGNGLLSKRAEDPAFVEEHGIAIDSDYYIHSQLLPPIERILSAVGVEKSELLGGGRQASIFDIMSGKKRKLKHEISIEHSLQDWEGLVCSKCNKPYRRMPLQGMCDCGGELLISCNGSTGTVMKKV